ncbi:MAG TPA: DDE-type integrase/transposase/recombinase [Nitrososphaerales archaeon]|nr:DDE-type integrase/transposase/recombinase [Nitrososphaerales archaeon]
MAIAKSATIKENEDGSFSVPSQTDRAVSYAVKAFGTEWTCDCPDFLNRADKIDYCKHVFAVRFWIASKVELEAQPKPKVFSEDATQCPKCGSIRVVKFGNYNGKQLYKCKDCRTKFREGLLKKAKYTPETITLTLDLYFSGLSTRKIARTVNDHFDMNLDQSTIYRWVERFIPQISAYVGSLTPQLSDTWHADELFVKMKGGETFKDKGAIAYLWNVMDRKTRFLLASKLSKYRDIAGADRAFVEASLNAGRNMPKKVFTDAHHAYRAAIKLWPEDKRPQHIAKASLRKPNATNNRIERLNGTLRERVKVQRGWKSMQTQIAEGQRIHYNFIKPHQALDGNTPAQVAGVGVYGNKWMELLRRSLGPKNTQN